jgi:hypothetical protein
MRRLLAVSLLLIGCEGVVEDPSGLELLQETFGDAVSCGPQMHVFPVAEPHNIGYDDPSCRTGTCRVSCPDQHANSDWGGRHHGIDVFARRGAPLVAVTSGTIVAVGTPSRTSGLRVRLRDGCGWEYYYGHLDHAVVQRGQHVDAGEVIGFMGNTGTSGVHLHFNVSPDGAYSNDINPFNLLAATSPTACAPAAPPPPSPPPPAVQATPGCGIMSVNEALAPNTAVTSCSGAYTFIHQGDGNVVLYNAWGTAIWHTHTYNRSTASLVMQGDGNLVLYTPEGVPIWDTGTWGHDGAILAVQDDGNAVIYDPYGRPLWATNTVGR